MHTVIYAEGASEPWMHGKMFPAVARATIMRGKTGCSVIADEYRRQQRHSNVRIPALLHGAFRSFMLSPHCSTDTLRRRLRRGIKRWCRQQGAGRGGVIPKGGRQQASDRLHQYPHVSHAWHHRN